MKVSVITAVYNAESTIVQAVNSVSSQSYDDVEHIIVDGGSTDATVASIKTVASPETILISEPDHGIYDALNKGLKLATGDIVGFLHSDDFFAHHNVLARIVAEFADPEVSAVFADLDYIEKEEPHKIIRHWSTGAFERKRLKWGWMPAHPTLYVRREAYHHLGGFDTGFAISADYDFILRYFKSVNGRCVYLPEIIYKMRVGGVSNRNMSKILQKMREDYRAIRKNEVGGILTMISKNISKIGQFMPRSKR